MPALDQHVQASEGSHGGLDELSPGCREANVAIDHQQTRAGL